MKPSIALHYAADALNVLREASDLYKNESDLFGQFQWIDNWLKHFQGRDTLVALTAREGERLVLAFPMVLRAARWRGVPVRELHSCTNQHSPSAALIVASDIESATIDAVADYLVRNETWDLFTCSNIRASQCGLIRIWEVITSLRRTVPFDVADQVILTCLDDWHGYMSERSASFRQQLIRTRRDLEFLGSLAVQKFVGPEVEQGFQCFLYADARSWKADDGEIVAGNRKLEQYYLGLLKSEALCGAVYVLKAGEQVISASLAFRSSSSVYGLKSSTVKDFESNRCSPGKFLLTEALEDVHAMNARRFECLSGASVYRRFSDETESVVSFRAFNDTLRGRAAFLAGKFLSSRARQEMPLKKQLVLGTID